MLRDEKSSKTPNGGIEQLRIYIRPTLKKVAHLVVHYPGEIKNSHKLPAGTNFFFFVIYLSKKIYNKNIKKYKQLIQ